MLLQTYLERIKKSPGTEMFQNTFFGENGKILDVTQDGDLSCAIFVSSILKMYDLISELHVNVASTITDMLNSGWYEISELKPGAVISWEKKQKRTGIHGHLGFCVDDSTAISNRGSLHVPAKHSTDYDGTRKIEKILWHPKLDH